MTVNVIVQARMGSKRLPGKVMMEMAGKPMIGHLIDHLSDGDLKVRHIIYAIPSCDKNGPLWDYLQERDCKVVTGPERDVAARFEIVLKQYPCDRFVRVCADSPICRTDIINHLIDEGTDGGFDQMSGKTGATVQICYTDLFLALLPRMMEEDREHVLLPLSRAMSTLVDTPEDFERVKQMLETNKVPVYA